MLKQREIALKCWIWQKSHVHDNGVSQSKLIHHDNGVDHDRKITARRGQIPLRSNDTCQ
jgi:hypothetical protein